MSSEHKEYIKLLGKEDTGFTFGVGDRTSSVRIPNEVKQNNRGYFEDRRYSGNIDPYLVVSKLYELFNN